MRMFFTNHAKERMLVRKITEKMIKETIAMPDREGAGYQNRFLVFKDFKRGTIKIVYLKEKGSRIIISVIWESVK